MSARKLLVGVIVTLIVALALTGATPNLFALPGLEGVAAISLFPPVPAPSGSPEPSDTPSPSATPTPSPAPAQDVGHPSGKGSGGSPTTPPPAAPTPAPTTPVPASAPPAEPIGQPTSSPASEPVAPAVSTTSSPAAPTGSAQPGFFNYTVAPGDDLPSIAERHGTTPEVIAAESGIGVGDTLYAGMSLRVPTTDPARAEPPLRAVAVPWSEVHKMWKPGTVAQVMDVRTGNIFYVMRNGGWAHADSEPVTAKDTAIMLSNYGGQWSWARRPIVVTINGIRIAASQNGMPHGGEILYNNNFPAHFCIHFLGSTTHGSSYTSNGVPTSDAAHQRAVQEAVGH